MQYISMQYISMQYISMQYSSAQHITEQLVGMWDCTGTKNTFNILQEENS